MDIISFENLSKEKIAKRTIATYMDIVELEGRDYLITLVTDPSSAQEGQIDVREVLHDWYANGTCVAYGNVDKSGKCEEFEALFNRSKIKEKLINQKWKPYDVLDAMEMDVHPSNHRHAYNTQMTQMGCVGIINKEEFEQKKTILRHIGDRSAIEIQTILEYFANPKESINSNQLKKK